MSRPVQTVWVGVPPFEDTQVFEEAAEPQTTFSSWFIIPTTARIILCSELFTILFLTSEIRI